MQISGTIESGAGKGAYFTQVDWVVRQCAEKLGFIPFPGTLNVNIRDRDLPELERLLATAEVELTPDDPAFCSAKVQPVVVEGIPSAIVLPSEEVRIHENRVVEILCPCHLKRTFHLSDGDSVFLSTRRGPWGAGQAPLYNEIYEFASSAGALEGFLYQRNSLTPSHIDNWVRNLSIQYRDLPEAARDAFQTALDRTVGRAVQSLVPLLGDDHPHVATLRSMLAGNTPASADDFEEEKAYKRKRYGD